MINKGRFIKAKHKNMWQQWLNLILGLWIILSAYLNFTTSQMVTNLIVSGVIVAGLSLWGALQHNMMMSDERTHRHA